MDSQRGFPQRQAIVWLRRWRFPIFVAVLAIVLGPGVMRSLGSSSSVWDWIGAGCLATLIVGLPLFVRDALRGDRPQATPERLEPTDVPDAAVQQSVSRSDDRISAIRDLREAHPGLGLKDAAELVDRYR